MRTLCHVAALISALAVVPYIYAQGPLERVFPDRFAHWTASSTLMKVKPVEEEYNVLIEAGVVDVMERTYSNGSQQLGVVLYQLRDPSSAYSVYTYLSQQRSRGQALFQVGNFVVLSLGTQEFEEADRRSLAESIGKHADATPLPPIRMYLPDEGRVGGTERYALGPIGFRAAAAALDRADFASLADQTGFASSAEAMFARYRTGKNEAVLLLLDYPTPQLAEQHLRHLELALPQSAREAGTPIERKGSLLAIVLSPSSAHYAKSLRDAVNYETQVTWNEPSATATDPPWTTVIARIFIGTGVFMVAAVVLGIAFGGLRVVTKILLPGKVFDRPERMEILQLGLSGKRIDPSDFY
jgi:hypothetical protein